MDGETKSEFEGVRNALFNFPELFGVLPDGTSLFQFHWQNRADLSETRFVAQGGPFTTFEACEAWLKDVFDGHKDDRPDGWIPLVMNDECEHFVWAASQAPAASDMVSACH